MKVLTHNRQLRWLVLAASESTAAPLLPRGEPSADKTADYSSVVRQQQKLLHSTEAEKIPR